MRLLNLESTLGTLEAAASRTRAVQIRRQIWNFLLTRQLRSISMKDMRITAKGGHVI
jgi:hypothetical protein